MRKIIMILFGFVLFNQQCLAQGLLEDEPAGRLSRNPKEPPKDQPKDQKVYNLDFEDELVEGGVQKPDLFYLIQRKNFNFRKLVRLRENFLPEMKETSEHLLDVGGNH